MTDGTRDIDEVNALDRDRFVARRGGLCEGAAWVAAAQAAVRLGRDRPSPTAFDHPSVFDPAPLSGA